MTGEFSTLAHMIAGAILAIPGPKVRDGERGLARHARHRLRHEACGRLMMRSHHLPAALLRGEEQMHEVRIGNAEERLDTLGFE